MKKILVLGAGFLQQFIIKRAHEIGYYVLAVDGNEEAVGFQYADEYQCISITDSEACLEYAKINNVNGVITAATEYGVISCAYITEKLKLPGNKINVAKLLKDKYSVRKCLIENAIDDIKQCIEIDAHTNTEKIDITFPVMVKPCEGSGSRGISRVNSEAELKQACQNAIAASGSGTAVIEDFIDGTEYGIESFVYDGNVAVLAVVRKHMTDAPFYAELGHSIPNDLPIEVENRAKKIAEKAIKALGIEIGGVNMDVLIDKNNNICIVDIGMRMGGNLIGSHLIPVGTGIDYMGNIIRAALGDAPVWERAQVQCIATKLLALTPGVVRSLPNMKEISDKYNVDILHHINIGDEISPYRNNLDGCGYVVAVGDDVANVLENAEKARDELDKAIGRR